jgi:methanogenic corrinoid protein MtbC1
MHGLVETELVPRLLDGPRLRSSPRVPGPAPVDADVDVLVELVLGDDVDACLGWIDALRAQGADPERLRDALIAPAARRLGERWDDDRSDFGQVTIGLGHLQSLVHHLAEGAPFAAGGPAGRLLLAKLPGADHLLGAVIVADTFRRAGWDVRFDPCAGEGELLEAVRAERFDVIGVTVALDGDYPAVRTLLAALRAASANPSVATMAGGPALVRWPALGADLGADLVPVDARDAVALAVRALSGTRVARPTVEPVPAPVAKAPTAPAAPDPATGGRRTSFRKVALRLARRLASITAQAA